MLRLKLFFLIAGILIILKKLHCVFHTYIYSFVSLIVIGSTSWPGLILGLEIGLPTKSVLS